MLDLIQEVSQVRILTTIVASCLDFGKTALTKVAEMTVRLVSKITARTQGSAQTVWLLTQELLTTGKKQAA